MTSVPSRPLVTLIEKTAQRFADAPALGVLGEKAATYGEVAARVQERAKELNGAGAPRLLSIEAPPGPDWVIELLATLRSGRVVALTPPGTPAPALGIDEDELGPDIALLAPTSGSTGTPRYVAITRHGLAANVASLIAYRPERPGDRQLALVPFHHLYGLVAGLLVPLAGGAEVVLTAPLLPHRLVEAMRAHRVTHVLAVPAWADAIAEELSSAPGPTPLGPQFETFCVGGAALTSATAETLSELGIGLESGYGLTEAGPVVSVGPLSECPIDSAGRPLPGVEVRIDESGEILVRSEAVMAGYVCDPSATASVLRDGWLHTGDRGQLDEHGCLHVRGRIKETLVTRTGETIHPDEIEPHYSDPLFVEHCVTGIPDDAGNDRPVLVVVRAAELSRDAAQKIFAERRSLVPPRLRVTDWIDWDGPLPRTESGKVRRRVIADTLREKGEQS